MKKKAILIVSFGTLLKKTKEETLDKITIDIINEFKDYKVFTAYSSEFIIKQLRKNNDYSIDNIDESMHKIISQNYSELIIQPTFISNGIEFSKILDKINKYRNFIDNIQIGSPLLSSKKNIIELSKILINEFSYVQNDQTIIFMGHGTKLGNNNIYNELNSLFESNNNNMHVAVINGFPTFEYTLNHLNLEQCKKIYLVPLMIVAGYHALCDMAGDSASSWKNILNKKGYDTECIINGLGNLSSIRKMYINEINLLILSNKNI